MALENAERVYNLSEIERDIILKHMWPLTVKLPRYRESYLVAFVDTYCSMFEVSKWSAAKVLKSSRKLVGFVKCKDVLKT